MKFAFAATVLFASAVSHAELIEVSPKLFDVPKAGWSTVVETANKFGSEFGSRDECLTWANNVVSVLRQSGKTIYSATCSNDNLSGVGRPVLTTYRGEVRAL